MVDRFEPLIQEQLAALAGARKAYDPLESQYFEQAREATARTPVAGPNLESAIASALPALAGALIGGKRGFAYGGAQAQDTSDRLVKLRQDEIDQGRASKLAALEVLGKQMGLAREDLNDSRQTLRGLQGGQIQSQVQQDLLNKKLSAQASIAAANRAAKNYISPLAKEQLAAQLTRNQRESALYNKEAFDYDKKYQENLERINNEGAQGLGEAIKIEGPDVRNIRNKTYQQEQLLNSKFFSPGVVDDKDKKMAITQYNETEKLTNKIDKLSEMLKGGEVAEGSTEFLERQQLMQAIVLDLATAKNRGANFTVTEQYMISAFAGLLGNNSLFNSLTSSQAKAALGVATPKLLQNIKTMMLEDAGTTMSNTGYLPGGRASFGKQLWERGFIKDWEDLNPWTVEATEKEAVVAEEGASSEQAKDEFDMVF